MNANASDSLYLNFEYDKYKYMLIYFTNLNVHLFFSITLISFQYQDIGSVQECVTRSKEMANIMDMVRPDDELVQSICIWMNTANPYCI